MRADSILSASRRDPSIIIASFGANILSLAIPMAMIHIYDRVIPNLGYETLTALGIMVVGAIIAEVLLRSARRQLLELAAERFERTAYPAAINALLQADPTQENHVSQGHLYRCVTGIERLRTIHVGTSSLDPLDLPFAFLFLCVIALISPVLGLSVFVILAFLFLVLRVARRGVLTHQIRRKDNEERRHSFLAELLRGIGVVKSMRIEDFMLRRYERLLGSAAAISADTARSVQMAQGFTALIGTLAPLLIGSVGAMIVIQGGMSVGSLAAIVLLTGRIIQPVLRIEAFMAGSENHRQQRMDLEEILTMPEIPEGALPLQRIDEIALCGVTTWPDPVLGIQLTDVNLTLKRGECLAVSGTNRQARGMLLRLLIGELKLAAGSIRLNGRDASEYRLEDRRRQIKLLGGDNTLVFGTLIENLTAFQPKLYRDRAIDLARQIGIEGTISQSPEGFDLKVGPDTRAALPKSLADAITIVGGLVCDPDVILFDEANGALDRDADARLLSILQTGLGDGILVLVSNRPSYLKMATRVIDVDNLIHTDASELAVS